MKDFNHIHKSEGDLTKAVLDDANARIGWSLNKIWQGTYSNSGVSDVQGCYKGFFVSLELKNPSKPRIPTDRQKKYIRDKINKGGAYFCYVIYNWNDWLKHSAYIERKVMGFRNQIYNKKTTVRR